MDDPKYAANQALCDEINGKVDKLKAEAAAERRILAALTLGRKYSKRSLALMTIGRGALIADMGSRGA